MRERLDPSAPVLSSSGCLTPPTKECPRRVTSATWRVSCLPPSASYFLSLGTPVAWHKSSCGTRTIHEPSADMRRSNLSTTKTCWSPKRSIEHFATGTPYSCRISAHNHSFSTEVVRSMPPPPVPMGSFRMWVVGVVPFGRIPISPGVEGGRSFLARPRGKCGSRRSRGYRQASRTANPSTGAQHPFA